MLTTSTQAAADSVEDSAEDSVTNSVSQSATSLAFGPLEKALGSTKAAASLDCSTATSFGHFFANLPRSGC